MIYLYNTEEKRVATAKEYIKFFYISMLEMLNKKISKIFKGVER